ncbi:ubiquinone biosynthesis protein [Lysinibacillus composti]|uniref:AarF/ABC1/UbiB kinase family protein n=1 Tax=Lysinibacillus composti TaxID=720633 RepID=A0A3N9UNK1_9BACI|nr:AarF/UbiB family protein [Lysinibacillus composti]MBM7609280.1 ubiquinone biosynthesis protein [Lysinibacillus composti]RQW74072.1 AarF/ABC1/UbiB kinase family protein [Lysinibacillus composti]
MGIIQQIIYLLIIAALIYFISGRLIGSNVNIFKRILSVILSVSFTTFVFWYSYLRNRDIAPENIIENVISVSTLLWIGSMMLISMLIYLFFELFDPIALDEKTGRAGRKTVFKKYVGYWRYQKRLRAVVKIAVTNGITRTVKYARNRENEREFAIALRVTLEKCGGIFIKFGQVLSTRKELFSRTIIEELEKLQQNVPEMTEKEVREVLAQNLPGDVDEVFTSFEMKPMAAASIGQVHKAILRETNEEVVVKLLRPQVKEIMKEDLSILLEFANWISDRSQLAESLGFRTLAEGFASSLREETDFKIEARNTIQIRNVLKNSKLKVEIPNVYEKYSNENLLILDYMRGQSIAHGDVLITKSMEERHQIAESLLASYLEQALVAGIFHADPHPGNIYYDPTRDELSILDFGSVCRLSNLHQEGLRLFFIGIQHNDASILYEGVALLVKNMDHVKRDEIENSISQILQKIVYVNQIQTDELVYSIFNVIREYDLQFYPSVSIALRVIVTLDGTLRIIDPRFNIFEESKAFSRDYMRNSILEPFRDPMEARRRLEEEMAMLLPNLRKIPRRIDQLVKKVEDGKVILHHDIFSDKSNSSFVLQLFSKFILLAVGITFGIISVNLLDIAQRIETVYAIFLNTAAYLGLFLCAILLVRLAIQAIRDIKKFK